MKQFTHSSVMHGANAGIGVYILFANFIRRFHSLIILFSFIFFSSTSVAQITITPSSQTVCNGSPTTQVNFSGGQNNGIVTTTYTWTCSTNIGAGTGPTVANNIPSFTASVALPPVTATITVNAQVRIFGWPWYTMGPTTATITVTPLPVAPSITTPTPICSGAPVVLTAGNATAGQVYVWYDAATGGNTLKVSTNNTDNTYTTGIFNNTTSYWVAIRQGNCESSRTIVTVNASPVINVQPINNAICSGANAQFSVAASGSGITYQWQEYVTPAGPWANISNGGIYSGATSNALTLTAPPAGYAGYQYRCVVSIGSCSIVSNAATLTFTSGASITTQPTNQSVCAGVPAVFSVTATGSTYQWYYSNNAICKNGSNIITDGAVFSGSTTNTLTVQTSTTNPPNARQYWVVVNTPGCGSPVPSGCGLLVVQPSPNFTSPPADVTVCEGSSTSFSATVNANPVTQPASRKWQYSTDNGVNWNDVPNSAPYSNVTTATLNISNAAISMSGYRYRMYIQTAGGCPGTTTSAILNVSASTTITSQPVDVSICDGNNAFFSVAATGTGTISYQWQVNTGSGFVNIPAGAPYSGETTSILSITGGTFAMNGYQYQCLVHSDCPDVTSNVATLTVSPPTITSQPTNQMTCPLVAVSFTVGAVNSPVYQWAESPDGGTNWNNLVNNAIYSGVTTATLTVTPTAVMNNYQYRCNITGPCPAVSNAVTLTINSIEVNAAVSAPFTRYYTTLKAAFDAINAGTHTGAITIKVNCSTTETVSAVLNASGSGSANYSSILMYPTIAGLSISGNLAAPLIDLNGADNVTVDGSTGGSGSNRDLTITNTNAGGATIRFIADASNNIIRNTVIKGMETSNSNGVIAFMNGTTTGNNNNSINNCNIASSSNTPANGFYSSGTSSAIPNSGNAITNCDIQDYFSTTLNSNGIFLFANSSAWTISGNKFYQSVARTPTLSGNNTYRAINIITASGGGYTINNNIIGYATSAATGATTYNTGSGMTNRFYGIEVTASNSTASSIQSNIITAITLSTTTGSASIFKGISVLAGSFNIGNVSGNIIGSVTSTNAISLSSSSNNPTIEGISVSSSGTINIQNNTVAGISTSSANGIGHTFYGINATGTSSCNITGNVIGNNSSNSITIGVSGSTTNANNFYGIYNTNNNATITSNEVKNAIVYNTSAAPEVIGLYNYNAAATMTNNNIHHLTATTTSGDANLFGIYQNSFSAGSTASINNNLIHDLTTTNTTSSGSALSGINSRGGSLTTGNIFSNKIYNLAANVNAGGTVSGITIWGGTTYNIYNNIIGNLTTTAATLALPNPSIMGMRFPNNSPTALNVYYNTIFLNASSTGSVFSTAGIYHIYHASQAVLTLRNNIIINNSTPSGTGRTIAFQRSAATNLNNYGTASNNNLFYAGTPGATRGIFYDGTTVQQTLANFQTLVGPTRDAASVTEATTPFLNTTIGANSDYLHFSNTCTATPTVAESGGANIATYTTDYDTDIRQGNAGYTGSGSAPDIGADEFGSNAIEVTATVGVLGPTLYSNLKTAFDNINNGTHRGSIIIRVLCSTAEPASCVLNASGSGLASYTGVNLYPAYTGLSITGNFATPLIDLNGADNVIIDGRVGGSGSTKDLILSNANTSFGYSIRFQADATANTVKYCTLSASPSSNGNVFFASGTTGNDGNLIDNCNIGPKGTVAFPTCGIYSSGPVGGNGNDNNTISNCNIYDFRGLAAHAGIQLSSNNSAWTLDGNNLYQTTSYTGSPTTTAYGIRINNSGNNYRISNNYIGGNAPQSGTWTLAASSDYRFQGIAISAGNGNIIESNRIQGFSWLTSASPGTVPGPGEWCGIYISGGNVTVGSSGKGNTIGDNTTGPVTVTNTGTTGINIFGIVSTSTGIDTIQYNTIGSLTATGSATLSASVAGIYASQGTNLIRSNIIGTSATNTLIASASSSSIIQSVKGIVFNSAANPVNSVQTISGNTIAYLNNNYAGGVSGQNRGISIEPGTPANFTGSVLIENNTIRTITTAQNTAGSGATANVTGIHMAGSQASSVKIKGNTIFDLRETAGNAAVSVIGIYYNGPNTANDTVANNFIYGLTIPNCTNTSAVISGIHIVAGTSTFTNNIISLGTNTIGAQAIGINDGGGSNYIYHNTVSLTGNSASATSDAAYQSTVSNVRNVRNNIFASTRSGATSTHRSVNITNAGATLTIGYNDYIGNMNGITLNVAPDNNSFATPPSFPAAAGTNLTDYIPGDNTLTGTYSLIASIPYDIDGNPRCVPSMGAQEKSTPVSTPAFSPPTSTRCQGAGSVPYTVSTPNTGNITYSLDATSLAAGNSINPTTGVVTYINSWTGTSTITASAAGCNGPATGTHSATTTATVGTPVFDAGLVHFRCQDAGSETYTATATNSTSITYSIDGGSSAAGNTINATTGMVTYTAAWNGTTTITASAAGCNGPSTNTFTVSVVPLPATPTLLPNPVCAGSTPLFTAGNGSIFQFFLNGISQGPASTSNTYTPSSALTAGDIVCVNSYTTPFNFDGILTEAAWGAPLATSAGGPNPGGFGASNNIDALYMQSSQDFVYGAIAGNIVANSNNRILLFIDCQPGGFNNLGVWGNRSNAPYHSIENLDNGITFDPGFEPDYILGMTSALGDAYFDLYNMQANTNYFLGTANGSGILGFNGNSGFGDYSKGFEFAIPGSSLGSPAGNIKVFAMVVNDPGFTGVPTTLSNEFLTRADASQGNYGNGAVLFGSNPPDPIQVFLSGNSCSSQTCITVQPLPTTSLIFHQ